MRSTRIAVVSSAAIMMVAGWLPVGSATVVTTTAVIGASTMIGGCTKKSDTRTEARTEARTAERTEDRRD